MQTHNFRELNVWQRARQFVKEIYRVSGAFPKEELFGLTNQIRKAAISIPSNIAEGCGQGSDRQVMQYCSVAMGSAFELETQLILTNDLDFIDNQAMETLLAEVTEIQKMIHGFINRFSV
ncbi:MAG: four helix bundle protein [Saprospiraceae bacterium]|nr:four helix bundle protein [Saprospiraceae bacterium]